MEQPYLHAISNRLFLALYEDELHYVVTDKNLKYVAYGEVAIPDVEVLQQQLGTHPQLKEIFGQVDLVVCNTGILPIPPVVNSIEDKQLVYSASHTLAKSHELISGRFNQDIALLYSVQGDFLSVLKEKFPSIQYNSDIEVMAQFTAQFKQREGIQLVCLIQGEELLMHITEGKDMLLANRFPCKSHEDVFYFIMLAVEQLEIDNEQLWLVWCESPEAFMSYANCKSLFGHYIGHIESVPKAQSNATMLNMRIACV